MTSFAKTRPWTRWSGSQQDLADAAEVARDTIAEWCGGEVRCDVQIEIGDLTTDADTTDALRSIDVRDLPDVRRVAASVSTVRHGLFSVPRASIRVGRAAPALVVEVHANDQVAVEGLVTRLTQMLDRGRRWPRWYQRLAVISIGSPTLVFAGALLGMALPRTFGLARVNGKWESAEVVGVAVGFLLGILLSVALWWLTPDLELVERGQPTRLRRWRALVIGAGSTIVLSLVGTALYAALT